jgi:hypothetical protein
MPTAIRSSAPPSPAARAAPRRLDLKVTENDPALAAEVRAGGKLCILRGVASNRGTVASFLQLEFDGKKVSVRPQRHQTAKDLREALRTAMPPGYALVVPQYLGRTGNDHASFEVHKVPRPKSNVAEIDAAFARALQRSSDAGAKLSKAELRSAVAVAEQGGLSASDKQALTRNWAALFEGASPGATPAAQKEFALLQERLDLP